MLFFKSKISLVLNIFVCLQAAHIVSSATTAAQIDFPDLYEASISELQAGLDAQHFSSVDLVKASISQMIIYLGPLNNNFNLVRHISLASMKSISKDLHCVQYSS